MLYEFNLDDPTDRLIMTDWLEDNSMPVGHLRDLDMQDWLAIPWYEEGAGFIAAYAYLEAKGWRFKEADGTVYVYHSSGSYMTLNPGDLKRVFRALTWGPTLTRLTLWYEAWQRMIPF